MTNNAERNASEQLQYLSDCVHIEERSIRAFGDVAMKLGQAAREASEALGRFGLTRDQLLASSLQRLTLVQREEYDTLIAGGVAPFDALVTATTPGRWFVSKL